MKSEIVSIFLIFVITLCQSVNGKHSKYPKHSINSGDKINSGYSGNSGNSSDNNQFGSTKQDVNKFFMYMIMTISMVSLLLGLCAFIMMTCVLIFEVDAARKFFSKCCCNFCFKNQRFVIDEYDNHQPINEYYDNDNDNYGSFRDVNNKPIKDSTIFHSV
jgi:hypothetical protein